MLPDEARLLRLEGQLYDISGTMSRNTAILEVNTELLDDHIKRTELLEEQVRSLALEARIIRWLGAAAAGAATILQLIPYFTGGK